MAGARVPDPEESYWQVLASDGAGVDASPYPLVPKPDWNGSKQLSQDL